MKTFFFFLYLFYLIVNNNIPKFEIYFYNILSFLFIIYLLINKIIYIKFNNIVLDRENQFFFILLIFLKK